MKEWYEDKEILNWYRKNNLSPPKEIQPEYRITYTNNQEFLDNFSEESDFSFWGLGDSIQGEEVGEEIREILEQHLDEKELFVLLNYIDNKFNSFQHVADQLNISRQHAHRLYHKAMQKLTTDENIMKQLREIYDR